MLACYCQLVLWLLFFYFVSIHHINLIATTSKTSKTSLTQNHKMMCPAQEHPNLHRQPQNLMHPLLQVYIRVPVETFVILVAYCWQPLENIYLFKRCSNIYAG